MSLGQVRSTPRHWMRARARLTPGLRFVYWAEQAHVCALVLDGVVVTVVTRSLCRRGRFTIVPGGEAEPIYVAASMPVCAGSAADMGFGEAA